MKEFFNYSAKVLLFVAVVSFFIRHLFFSGEMFILEALGTGGFLFGFLSLAMIAFCDLKEGTLLQRRQRVVGIFFTLGMSSLYLYSGLRFLQVNVDFLILPVCIIAVLLVILAVVYVGMEIVKGRRKK
ncbi:MAG: hypothetical protein ACK5N8_08050 [Alphaproteobacteria bacterium]